MENSAFLSGGGATVKRPPVPQSEFSVNDRAMVMEHHDSYDVFTGQGLRDWQFHVIETVAGTSYVALWPMTSANKKCRMTRIL